MFWKRDIYSVLADNFALVFHVKVHAEDKRRDTFRLDRADPAFLRNLPDWKTFPTFSEQLDFIADTLVHPDDRESFYEGSRREVLLERLSSSRAYYLDFRLLVGGKPRYFEFKVNAVRDRSGRICMFVIGFQDDDKIVRSKCLDATERMRRTMSFFSEHYALACRRNLEDDTYSVISAADGERKAGMADMFFSDALRRRCERSVYAEDRKLLLDNLAIPVIRARLKERRYFVLHFRDITTGTPRWWTLRVNRIDGYEDEVIIAMNDTDEDVRRDIDRETRIATARENSIAMDRVLQALKSGSPLSDLGGFLEIVRERFDAEGCAFVRYDFAREKAVIDAGCAVRRGGPLIDFAWECALSAFEPQLMDLTTQGFCSLEGKAAVTFFRDCHDHGVPQIGYGFPRHVAVPVLVAGRMRGALNVDYSDDRPLSELERGNLRGLADVLGAAIERRETYQSLEKAQRQAAIESAFANRIIDLLPVPCYLKDTESDFRYVRCNAAFERLVGLPKSEIIGRTDWDLLDPKMLAEVRAHDFAALESDRPHTYISELHMTASGSGRKASHCKQRLIGADGHALILCVIADLGPEAR